jgi:hypothetical protein
MTKFDEIANRPDHSGNWFAPDGLNSLALDGIFTKEQLLELIQAMETPDGNPISLADRLPSDQDCDIVECSAWKMRRCWLGKPLYHAGNKLWIWEWAIAPETLKLAPWPHTHWLPADTETLPARND